MAHKVLSSDMASLIQAMRLAQQNSTTSLDGKYRKGMLKAAHVLAMDSKNLLDVVDRARRNVISVPVCTADSIAGSSSTVSSQKFNTPQHTPTHHTQHNTPTHHTYPNTPQHTPTHHTHPNTQQHTPTHQNHYPTMPQHHTPTHQSNSTHHTPTHHTHPSTKIAQPTSTHNTSLDSYNLPAHHRHTST